MKQKLKHEYAKGTVCDLVPECCFWGSLVPGTCSSEQVPGQKNVVGINLTVKVDRSIL